jgi:ankyrin repeat protein
MYVHARAHADAGPFHTPRAQNGVTVLHHAAMYGMMEAVTLILNHGAGTVNLDARTTRPQMQSFNNVLQQGSSGEETPLHSAIIHRHEQVALALLAAGASVDLARTDGCTALHLAAKHGAEDAARELLARGASLAARNKCEQTPLHMAAAEYNCGVLYLLIVAAGAEALTAADASGNTLLHVCAEQGHDGPAAKALQKAGAPLGAALNKAGLSPLHIAAKRGVCNAALLLLLLEHAQKEGGCAAIDVCAGPGEHCGSTPLHLAAASCSEGAVLALVKHNAALDAADATGNTALHLVARGNLKSAFGIASFGSPTFGLGDLDRRAVAIATALVEAGASVTACNNAGRTPADLASSIALKKLLTRAPSAALPDDFTAWLAHVGFATFTGKLVRLGYKCLADLRHLQAEDLVVDGDMTKVERYKFMEAVRRVVVDNGLGEEEDSGGGAGGGCDVMLSYRVSETGEAAGGDRTVVELSAALRSLGYSVFVGEAAIQASDNWPRTIQNGVEGCGAFVALCSTTYGDETISPWTFRELVMADALKKPLITIWHSGVYPPPALAIYLSAVQRIPGGMCDMRALGGVNCILEELVATLRRMGVTPGAAAARALQRSQSRDSAPPLELPAPAPAAAASNGLEELSSDEFRSEPDPAAGAVEDGPQ